MYGVAYGDESGGSFQIYSKKEFEKTCEFYMDTLNVFTAFSSTIAEEYEYSDEKSDLNKEAWAGKCAVAYGTKLVTEFVYDSSESSWRKYNSIIAVKLGDKWGVVDKDGKVVIPFVLEEAISIDDMSAFGKYNGKYGIMRVTEN